MDVEITLLVNGTTHRLSVDTRTTLLDALREQLRITSGRHPIGDSPCAHRASEHGGA